MNPREPHRRIAAKYVDRLRRKHPQADTQTLIRILDRRYIAAVGVAGGLMTAGTVAAGVALARLPGAKGTAKVATKATGRAASSLARRLGSNAARVSAAKLLPAGDRQAQFELTLVYLLALAELHEVELTQARARELVHGMSDQRSFGRRMVASAHEVFTASS